MYKPCSSVPEACSLWACGLRAVRRHQPKKWNSQAQKTQDWCNATRVQRVQRVQEFKSSTLIPPDMDWGNISSDHFIPPTWGVSIRTVDWCNRLPHPLTASLCEGMNGRSNHGSKWGSLRSCHFSWRSPLSSPLSSFNISLAHQKALFPNPSCS